MSNNQQNIPALGHQAGVVVICNKALRYLGAGEILSFSQQSREAEVCAAHYAGARDELLELHPWSFATKIQNLAPLLESKELSLNKPDNLQYSYSLPSDCLKLRYIFGNPLYLIAGRVVYSDSSPLKAVLSMRIENTVHFPALFIETLARRLAAALAVPLINNHRLEQVMHQRFNEALEAAKLADSLEDGCKIGFDSEFSAKTWSSSNSDSGFSSFGVSDSWLNSR